MGEWLGVGEDVEEPVTHDVEERDGVTVPKGVAHDVELGVRVEEDDRELMVRVGVLEGDRVPLPQLVMVPLPDVECVPVPQLVMVEQPELEGVPVVHAEVVELLVWLEEGVGQTVGVVLTVMVGERDEETVGVVERVDLVVLDPVLDVVMEEAGLADILGVLEGQDGVEVPLVVAEVENERVLVGVPVEDTEPLREMEGDGEWEEEREGEVDTVGLTLSDPSSVGVGSTERDKDWVVVVVEDTLFERVREEQAEFERVRVVQAELERVREVQPVVEADTLRDMVPLELVENEASPPAPQIQHNRKNTRLLITLSLQPRRGN